MLEKIIPGLLFFMPALAIGCWITWAVKRSQINNVPQSWMRQARIDSARRRFIAAIVFTVIAVVVLIVFLPGAIRDSKEAAAAANAAAESMVEASQAAAT